MTKTERRQFGDWGEEQAALFLVRNDYQIVERNFQIRDGELDIVAKKPWNQNYSWHFIEVKTRSYFGDDNAERAVDWKKVKKMVKVAKLYCLWKAVDVDSLPIHFEQVSVYIDRENKKIQIKKYELPVLAFIN